MKSHNLARLLLALPDLPVATFAHGHVYISKAHKKSHGPLRVGRLYTYAGDHIVVGDVDEGAANSLNWRVTEMLEAGLR